MKTLIIEDENMASQALCKLIEKVSPGTEVVGVLQTIDESKAWFKKNEMPDLIFMDIHLADGSSFAIFDKVDITCPIIFTTAYDEYALKAFEVNSIDYLLKPIGKKDLERAMNKYKSLTEVANQNYKALASLIDGSRHKYKKYFLLPESDKLVPLAAKNIAYIFIDEKVVKIVTFDRKSYYINQTLDELLDQLDTSAFFRANRQYIVARESIKDVSIWLGNKLALNLIVEVPDKIIISKARVSEFKQWFAD
ncbi:MAG: LytTR family DNA-binding domain-containing protein [Bacteroidales bacterium]|nr:LytTR family DNA-binding domain-containing protein [Bacteroidales bacterium]